MNKIKSRQLYLYFLAIAPVGKLVLMPTQLAVYAGNDLLFPAAANIVLQSAVIFFVMLLARRNKSLYALVEARLGSIAGKLVCTLFSLFFLYAALLPLLEQKLMVQSVFYDTLPSTIAFAPFFLLSAYLCAKPLSSLGRAWDVLAPLSIAGFSGIVLLSAGGADFGALKPVFGQGGWGFLRGSAYTMSWFFDSALALSFLGKVEYKAGMAWKSALCYLAGGAAVLLFLALFYGTFAEVSVRQLFAFTKTAKYFSGVAVLGRVDYLFIFALALVMAFYCALPMQASVDCVREAFAPKNRILHNVLAILVNAGLLLGLWLLNFDFLSTSTAIAKTLFWIFPVFTVLLPLILLAFGRDRVQVS